MAEATGVVTNGLTLAAHFGDGEPRGRDVAASIIGTVAKDPVQDQAMRNESLETAVKKWAGWKDFYAACREVS
ncbi:hypothetical protein [Deinococcus petrolearius]|uniref:Uncharacterized protein n=1 Tax=Deinococcus petrolearius TaxID=1751295 RepID=A0ABW1DH27_9DEIO